MKNTTFTYQYSAQRNKEIESIRNKYLPHEESELERLKKLDAKVKRPANVFAYVFGSIGAIIMGAGMSLVMTDVGSVIGLGNVMIPGVSIGLIGMAMALLTYPIYKGILNARKKKYAPQVLEISEKIMDR